MFYKERWDKQEFNGYLNSLRFICDKKGIDYFCITNNCDLNRTQKLYNTNLHGSNYILPVLFADNFDAKYAELVEKNKSVDSRVEKYDENKKILENQLKIARRKFCGIGTKQIKLLLNSLIDFDVKAKILRLLLEIEDKSIVAKNSFGDFAKYRYHEKLNLIEELIFICEHEGFLWGYKDSDIPSMKSIIFFDIYDKQFSWHTKIEKDNSKPYQKEWDGMENSTLLKIEGLLMEEYSELITNNLQKDNSMVAFFK